MKNHDLDAELIRQVAEGNESAFEALVEKYQHPVVNTIYRYISDSTQAEDVAQEVFVKVWQHAGSFRGKSKFSTWLYKIVVNQCLNYRSRERKNTDALDRPVKDETPEADVSLEAGERQAAVRKAIDELPEKQRIALILSRFDRKSYKEISEIMRCSLSSVESLIFRAKENLKKKIVLLIEKKEI
jgi:RNA polymerase sigma-70 factor (ECF subfamily)